MASGERPLDLKKYEMKKESLYNRCIICLTTTPFRINKEITRQACHSPASLKSYHHGEFLLLGVPIWGYYRNYRLIVNNLNLHSKMLILFFIYYIWYKHKIKEKNISAIRMLSILYVDLGCDIWYFRRRKTI